MANDTVDWSQFTPADTGASATPAASGVDWSQFQPVPPSGQGATGDAGFGEQAPDFGEDRAASEQQALHAMGQIPDADKGKTVVGTGEMATRGLVGSGGGAIGLARDIAHMLPGQQLIDWEAKRVAKAKGMTDEQAEAYVNDLDPLYHIAQNAKDYAQLKENETTTGEGRIAGGLTRGGATLSLAAVGGPELEGEKLLAPVAEQIEGFLGTKGAQVLKNLVSGTPTAAKMTALGAQDLPDNLTPGEKAKQVSQDFLFNLAMAGLPTSFGKGFLPKTVTGAGIGAGTSVAQSLLNGQHQLDLPDLVVSGAIGSVMGHTTHGLDVSEDAKANYAAMQEAAKQDPDVQNQLDITDKVASAGGLSPATINAGKEGALATVAAARRPHEDLMQSVDRYRDLYNTAKQDLPDDQAQAYAKATYLSELGENTAWGAYTQAVSDNAKLNRGRQMYSDISQLAGQAMHAMDDTDQLAFSRWMELNKPTAPELHAALQEASQGTLPDYISEAYGKDFDKNGHFTEEAFRADQARSPEAMTVFFPKTPEMATLFEQAGARPYALDDRYAVLGDPTKVAQLTSAIQETTGVEPVYGEDDAIQQAGRNPAREGQDAAGRHGQGNEAAVGSEAEGGQLQRAGQGNEGAQDHQGEEAVTTESLKRAGTLIDRRLAALDEAAGRARTPADMKALGKEHGELEDLLRQQYALKQKGSLGSADTRLSDAEIKTAEDRLAAVKGEMESHRHAVGAGNQASQLRAKLAGADDAKIQQIAEGLYPERAKGVLKALKDVPRGTVDVDTAGTVVIHPGASDAVAEKALDAAAADTGATNTEFAEPTPAQASSGNYRKGGVLFKAPEGDIRVRIENPDGSVRRGAWGSRPLKDAHYGYIPGTVNADGEPLDVLLTRKAHDSERKIAVISQHDPETGKFDEIKLVMGAGGRGEAMTTYLKQYPANLHKGLLPQGKRNITMMTRDKFMRWLESKGTYLPPHPVSGQPMFKLKEEGSFTASLPKGRADKIRETVDKLNEKYGLNLKAKGTSVDGTIPRPYAGVLRDAFSRLDGYKWSTLDGTAIQASRKASVEPAANEPSGVPARVRKSGIQESSAPEGIKQVKSDAPLYQEGQGANPVSVVGVHFSPHGDLTHLDPSMAGSGSAGGERRRLGMGQFGKGGDPMSRMTHFYVREGEALPPKESAVIGEHAYEARLNNLYDVARDPDGIIAKAHADGFGNNIDYKLEAIHDAGYDGVVHEGLPGMDAKHVATVFGVDGKIPVKNVTAKVTARPGEMLHPWTPQNKSTRVPLTGGVHEDGSETFIDKRFPKTFKVEGKDVDVHEGIHLHERREWTLMHPKGPVAADVLKDIVAQAAPLKIPPKILGMIRRGEPLDYSMKPVGAHEIAQATENNFYRQKYGVDPQKVQRAMKDHIERTEREAANSPEISEHLDDKPYVDGGDEHLLAKKGPRFMFAGEKAKSPSDERTVAREKMLARAKDLIGEGHSAADVWTETGWYQGKDGKWRREISDARAKIDQEKMAKPSVHKLADVLDHPQLFEEYPHLKDMKVEVRDMPDNQGGALDPETNTIIINTPEKFEAMRQRYPNEDHSQISTLLHEVQHDIQYREGFGTGGSPNEFLAPRIAKRDAGLRILDEINSRLAMANERGEVAEADRLKMQRKLLQEKMIEEGLNDPEEMERRSILDYARLSGEVEARNVQKRRTMDTMTRRFTDPQESADVKKHAEIVKWGSRDKMLDQLTPEQSERLSQFSWEAVPSTSVPGNEWLHSATPEFKRAYTDAVNKAVGKTILDEFGIEHTGTTVGFGGWEGDVNPSVQEHVRKPLTEADRLQLEKAAATYGLLLKQDGVAWHSPDYTTSAKEANGVHVQAGRPLTADETSRIYDKVVELAKDRFGISDSDAKAFAPIPSPGGVRFLNFHDEVPNTGFSKMIHDAVESVMPDDSVQSLHRFKSDGDLIGNNWQENPHGEGYRQRLLASGGWDSARRAGDRIGPALERINQEFRDRAASGEAGEAAESAAHPGEPAKAVDREQIHEQAVKHAAKLTEKWAHRPIEVLRSRNDIADESLKAFINHTVPEDMTPAGVYHDGKVYVFSDAHDSLPAMERTIAHELIGHFGMRGMLGDEMPAFLDDVHQSVRDAESYKALERDYEQAYGHLSPKAFDRAITEEYIAHLAETRQEPGLWKTIVAKIRAIARKLGLVSRWTDDDLYQMLGKVASDMREGRVGMGGAETPQTMFHAEDNAAETRYTGSAGEGTITHYEDGSRDVDLGTVKATTHYTTIGDQDVMSVSDLTYASPGDLAKLARFAGEEGKDLVAIGKQDASRDDLERSGVTFTERPGHYELEATRGSSPMFAMRNRQSGGQAVDDLVKKVVAHDELNMSPWDRFQRALRHIRDGIQSGDSAMRLKQGYVDAWAPVERLEREANGGLLLDASQSAYKMAWMAQNNEQITAGILKVGVPKYDQGSFIAQPGRKGLVEIFRPLFATANGKMLDGLWEGYAYAKRANELIDQFNPDGSSKEKLLTRPEIDTLLNMENTYPAFKQVFDEYQTFNKQLLDLAVDRGAMSQETADLWKQNMYVPFYRHSDETENTSWMFKRKGISGKKVTSRRLYGSDKQVDPIIDNIIRNTGSILDKIYSNEAMRRVVALADGIGMERVRNKIDNVNISMGDIEKTIAKMGFYVGAKRGPGKYSKYLTQAEMDQVAGFIRMSKPVGNDIVSVMQNGKPVYYKVTDDALLKSITAFDQLGHFDRLFNLIFGGPKKLLTMGVIYNPGFMYRTFFRDAVTAWMQTGTNPNMFKNAMRNAKDVYTDSDFQNGLRAAGFNGNAYFNAHEMREHLEELHAKNGWTLLSTPKKLWHAYHKIGMMAEQINRLSVARHVLERGGSMAEAAWQGQNTLNFKMRGSNKAMQLLIRTVPFLNARIQGLNRLYLGMTGRDVTINRTRAVTSYVLKAMSIMAASLALQVNNWNDKRYQRIPEVDKDLYYHYFFGNQHFTLPKPFETGAMFSTIPERALRAIAGKDNERTFVESMQRTFMHTLDFDPTPQTVAPLLEDWANKDKLSEHPIVSQQYAQLEPEAQYGPTTSPLVTGLAQHMPNAAPDMLRSPMRLQHLIQGYTGSVGMYLLQGADATVRGLGGAPAGPASRYGSTLMENIAGPLGFTPADTDPRNKYVQQVYDAQDEADKAYKTVQAEMKQGHLQEARRVMQDNKTAIQYRETIHQISGELGELRKVEMAVYQSNTMTRDQKRAKLDQVNEVRTKLLDRAAPLLEIAADYH